jgi:Kef-type K+ transport system membrane component KefB
MWIVLVFVILRVLGKIFGAFIGAIISGAQEKVKKYTAFGLIPQGGIVVGLALLVKQNPAFSSISPVLLNMILGTTVLFEFIGPLFTELALKRAKEVGKE